jgi:c-di-GMP-binding flagellar brake protein YcgR
MKERPKMTVEEVTREEDEIPLTDLNKPGKSFFFPVGLPLQVEISGVSLRMSSVSVGYLAGNWLIIKYPSTGTFGSIASKLFKGNKITVRYINEGDVFGFQSQLLGMTVEPMRLLFIAFPASIARRSLRSTRRIECYLPADMYSEKIKDGDIVRDGIILDVSIAGCNFTMVRGSAEQVLPEVRMNDAIQLYVQLPGMEEKIALAGSIRNIQRDSQRISLGVQFNDVDEERKNRLLEFISTLEKFSWEK